MSSGRRGNPLRDHVVLYDFPFDVRTKPHSLVITLKMSVSSWSYINRDLVVLFFMSRLIILEETLSEIILIVVKLALAAKLETRGWVAHTLP